MTSGGVALPNKALQTGVSVASLPLATAVERRYVGQAGLAPCLD